MYDYNSPYGESCYRLMTRTGNFIYLRTRGYLDIDRDTNQVRSFVCVNALVDEEEGKKLVKEMKKKFTIMIQETEITSNEPDVPAVENPVQLERAIISLITNLHSGNEAAGSPETQGSNDGHESDTNRSVKSPPLEIIPPKASSIKTSIVSSMDVVKHLTYETSDSDDDKSMDKRTTSKMIRTTVMRRSINQNTKLNEESNRTKSNATSSSISKLSTSQTMTTPSNSKTRELSLDNTSPDSLIDNITIKQEGPDSFEDSRVPPLPTNASYFEMSPYNSQQYLDDIASPLECKPEFDFLGFDPMQVQQADQSRFLTPETAAQYQQFDTGDTSNRPVSNSNDTPDQVSTVSGIKRSCSSENLNNTNKRRFCSAPQKNAKNDGDCSQLNNEKQSMSIHQTCIDHLNDPELGNCIFIFRKKLIIFR